MGGYKLGATPNGVAIGGPSHLENLNPRWKRELDDLINEAVVEGESGILGDTTGEQVGHFAAGQFCLRGQ